MRTNSLFRTTDVGDLDKVTWLAHDCWFDLDEVRWERTDDRVDVPFGRGRERDWRLLGMTLGSTSGPPTHYDCVLRIRNVTSVAIDDRAEVGVYDINEIRYKPESSTVVIEAGIPLEIQVVISRFDIEVASLGKPHSDEGGLSWYTAGEDLESVLRVG